MVETAIDKQFVYILYDNMRKQGVIYKLLSDSSQVEITGQVNDNLRAYNIEKFSSEAQ